MRKQAFFSTLAVFAVVVAVTVSAAAQNTNPRFGVWKLKSDAPPPQSNIMTYEPWGDGGMSITVESTNARGDDNAWGYNTMFDGEFREVWGQENASTAVEWVNERTTRIWIVRDGDSAVVRTGPSTRWFANLARDPRCRIRAGDLEVRLVAETITDVEARRAIDEAFRAKYGWQESAVVWRSRAETDDPYFRLIPDPTS